MCWAIKIWKDQEVIATIETVKQAAEYFGAEFLRYVRYDSPVTEDEKERWQNYPVDVNDECCLCPIDKEFLLTKTGYQRILDDDPRFSYMDIAVEKVIVS